MEPAKYSRRDVLKLALPPLAGLVSIAVLPLPGLGVSGCGRVAGPATHGDGDVFGSVGDNHLHTARLTREMLEAAEEMDLDITGTSDHPHWIHLTSQNLRDIKNGNPVSVQSTRDWGHVHVVHFFG